MGADIREDAGEGADFEWVMTGNGDVMLAALVRRKSYMVAALSRG